MSRLKNHETNPFAIVFSKKELSWMFYDWASSGFATTVLAGFFPLFFKSYWGSGLEAGKGSAVIGIANSIATVVVLLVAILWGGFADNRAVRKRTLIFFCIVGSASTGCLCVVGKGNWHVAIVVFIISAICFFSGNIFYDSLLVNVTPNKRRDFVSASGYGLGYLGGGLLFLINIAMFLKPSLFGVENGAGGIKLSFFTVGLWWFIFALPLMVFVREEMAGEAVASVVTTIVGSVKKTIRTLGYLPRNRALTLFLLAFWLYNDAVVTVVKMAVTYGDDIGIGGKEMMMALLMVQFIGFPSAILFGKITERVGRKRMIFAGILAYIFVVACGGLMRSAVGFFLLAIIVAFFQGGIQAISRSFYTTLIPEKRTAEFFGFYNVGAHFSSLLGPAAVGMTGYITGNPRAGILVLEVFLIVGAFLLAMVKEDGSERAKG